jgi:hypothetical protein
MKKNIKNIIIYLFVIVMFVWGALFISKQPIESKRENFISNHCPTMMVRDGTSIYVFDPSKEKIAGVNPIKLNNLEEYKSYLEWQRNSKSNCPILHLEHIYSADGSNSFEIKPNYIDPTHGGLEYGITENTNSSSSCVTNYLEHKELDNLIKHPVFNRDKYQPFDPYNQTQGNPGVLTLGLM